MVMTGESGSVCALQTYAHLSGSFLRKQPSFTKEQQLCLSSMVMTSETGSVCAWQTHAHLSGSFLRKQLGFTRNNKKGDTGFSSTGGWMKKTPGLQRNKKGFEGQGLLLLVALHLLGKLIRCDHNMVLGRRVA